MNYLRCLMISFCIGILISSDAAAVEKYRAEFLEKAEYCGQIFYLQGAGPKSYLFIRVFVAGFYLGGQADSERILEDVPKRLEVHYRVKVPARQLAQETRKRIKLNLTQEDFQSIVQRVDVMDGYFVNLKPGDVYALTYVPGIGTQFTHNGRLIGTIEGADFAKGLFSVWFGEEPLDETLKKRLSGKQI